MDLIDFALIASMIYAAPDIAPKNRTLLSGFWVVVALIAIVIKVTKGD